MTEQYLTFDKAMTQLPDFLARRIVLEGECWKWRGSISGKHGYGRVPVKGQWKLAHRVIEQILVGKIAPDSETSPACGDRLCVRPEHLLERPAPRCGTKSMAMKHYRMGEKPCLSCREALREYDRKRREQPGAYEHTRRIKWKNKGIDPDEAERLYAEHNGACAICQTKSPGSKGWHLDHDHNNGTARGVLCNHCNVGLGMFKDSPRILRAAIEYLSRHV